MYRIARQALLDWKGSRNKKPLILRGARQVGKTTLLKDFAQNEFTHHVYLNFEDKPALKSLFQEDLDSKRIIEAIGLTVGNRIMPEKTLLIFDEIQECPEALNSLKYFCENAPEYPICAAGSLLGVKLVHTKGFPVGKVEFADLYPMNFAEYLLASGEALLHEHLANIKSIQPLPQIVHDKLTRLFKQYLFIGGMPEIVSEYVIHRDISTIRKKQSDILDAYSVDFAKHAPKSDVLKISEIWQSLPSQLAKENKRFVYSKIKASARGREYDNAMQWLVDAGLIYKVFNVTTPKHPLSGYADVGAFKIYSLDAGLLGAMADISPKLLVQGNDLFAHYHGSFIENYVGQALKPHFKQLHYWTSEGKAELDYLIQYDNDIFPVEVKSGTSRTKKSLRVYKEKFNPRLAIVLSPANLIHDGNILNCPLYMADYLSRNLIELALAK